MLLLSLSIRERVHVIDQLVFLPGKFHSFRQEEKGELLAKNIARTARRQLDGWHLLTGKYLQD